MKRIVAILWLLALCTSAPAVVAVDGTTATQTNVNAVTTMTISNLTVGAGTNRALLVHLGFTGSTTPAGLTVVWDPTGANQTMTAIPGTNSGTNGALSQAVVLYGLVNPASGNKNLVVTWTGSTEAHATAISFTGVMQTSVAAAFPNGNVVSNLSAVAPPAQVTITSATGNIVTAVAVQNVANFGGAAGSGGTIIANANTGGPAQQLASSYYPGASSVVAGVTWSGSTAPWIASGSDVAQFVAPPPGGNATMPLTGVGVGE